MKTVNFRDFQNADTDSKNGDCAKALQAALEYIKVQGEPCTLCFPPNEDIHIYKDFCKVRTYHTSNTDSLEYPEKTIGILLEEQKDLIFAGNGCRFIFHGDLMAIAVVHCENIVLRDFSWDFENPTASQLTVKQVRACSAVFEAAEGCDFKLEKGKVKWIFSQSPYTGKPYQVQYNEHEACLVVGLDPESGMQRRYSLAETPFSRAIHIKRLSERKIKISYFGKTPKPWRKTGMVAQMVASKHRQTAGAFLWESKNVKVDSVSPHYFHSLGWLTQMCYDVSFENCHFVPGEGGRYCTSFADHIHVSGAAGKIKIENCEFKYAHDDPINVHGTFTRVEEMIGERTLRLRYVHAQQGGFPQFHAGDEVVFYARDTLACLGEKEEIYIVEKAGAPGEDGNDFKTMTVTFTKALPLALRDKIGDEPKYVAENITYTPEVVIRNCLFDHITTRGILCTTRKKVLIENNRFDHITMACIYISNDADTWYESGPVRDMTIRNNEFFIRESGQCEWNDTPAVYVHPVVKGESLPVEPVHKNIAIENNIVHLFHDRAFVLESVENLYIHGNKIIRSGNCADEVCICTACKNIKSDME